MKQKKGLALDFGTVGATGTTFGCAGQGFAAGRSPALRRLSALWFLDHFACPLSQSIRTRFCARKCLMLRADLQQREISILKKPRKCLQTIFSGVQITCRFLRALYVDFSTYRVLISWQPQKHNPHASLVFAFNVTYSICVCAPVASRR